MLMWTLILALLIIALCLIIIELVFIPGTTFVGLLGLFFAIAGIVISYRSLGSETGFYILLGMSVTTLAALVYSFKAGVWTKFSLKSSIDSRVNEGLMASLHIGDMGKSVSTLRPVGKAEFNSRQYEVKTLGEYLDKDKTVRIINIEANQIIVEPTN
jgi:membrane-bound ClpP family serine protease